MSLNPLFYVCKSTYKALEKAYETSMSTNEELLARNRAQEHIIQELADDIRSMDQLIYNMSQCLDWDDMKEHFHELRSMQQVRQELESNRINNILNQELLDIYKS
jgi:hypothetical protein